MQEKTTKPPLYLVTVKWHDWTNRIVKAYGDADIDPFHDPWNELVKEFEEWSEKVNAHFQES